MSDEGRAEGLHHAAMIVRAQATAKRKATTEELVAHLRSIKANQPAYAAGIEEAIEEIQTASPGTAHDELAARIEQRARPAPNP